MKILRVTTQTIKKLLAADTNVYSSSSSSSSSPSSSSPSSSSSSSSSVDSTTLVGSWSFQQFYSTPVYPRPSPSNQQL